MSKPRTVLFFFRAYNDVDSLSPVVMKMLEKGDRPICVFTHGFDHESDYRFAYFRSRFDFPVFDIAPTPERRRIWLNRLERLPGLKHRTPDAFWFDPGFSTERFLHEHEVCACAYEYGPPGGRSPVGQRTFNTAKRLGIPTFYLPHGLNIYLNRDVNFDTRITFQKTGAIQSDRSYVNEYDCAVFTGQRFMENTIAEGVSPTVAECWGSPRYDPSWASLNRSLCPPFTPAKNSEGRLKVVFMVPHWEYNVDAHGTCGMLRALAERNWIHLVVKGHTRGEELFDDEQARLNALPNVEMASHAHSTALIVWSDAVINIGSSIGIEALLQDKPLLHAGYLHHNQTIFEHHGAAHILGSEDELLNALEALRDGTLPQISTLGKEALLRDVVYGGKAPHDVAEYYWRRLTGRDVSDISEVVRDQDPLAVP